MSGMQIFAVKSGEQCYRLPYLSSSALGSPSPSGTTPSFPIPTIYNYVPQVQLGQVGVLFFEQILQDYLNDKLSYKELNRYRKVI